MTSKQPQVLQIEPAHELTFKGPFTNVVTNNLKLTNPTDTQVCYKVKTTAPKQYCVRPNSGLIAPKESVDVLIMLQPLDITTEEFSKHKFMVQSTFVHDGETNIDSIWKNTAPGDLMDSKLRVILESPDGTVNNVELTATPPVIVSPPLKTSTGGNENEVKLRRLSDENKRLIGRIQLMKVDNEQLKSRLAHLESLEFRRQGTIGSSKSGSAQELDSHFHLQHVVMVVFVALFLGVIFGKVF